MFMNPADLLVFILHHQDEQEIRKGNKSLAFFQATVSEVCFLWAQDPLNWKYLNLGKNMNILFGEEDKVRELKSSKERNTEEKLLRHLLCFLLRFLNIWIFESLWNLSEVFYFWISCCCFKFNHVWKVFLISVISPRNNW